MTTPDKTPNASSEHHKDSCEYAVGIANQFLTLSSAGLAFLVGLALASESSLGWTWYTCGALLILSIVAGLVFTMSVVAHINQENKYDVYCGMLKNLSMAQIATFLGAVVFMAIIVIGLLPSQAKPHKSDLFIKAGDKELRQAVPDGVTLTVNVSTGNTIQVEMKPK